VLLVHCELHLLLQDRPAAPHVHLTPKNAAHQAAHLSTPHSLLKKKLLLVWPAGPCGASHTVGHTNGCCSITLVTPGVCYNVLCGNQQSCGVQLCPWDRTPQGTGGRGGCFLQTLEAASMPWSRVFTLFPPDYKHHHHHTHIMAGRQL